VEEGGRMNKYWYIVHMLKQLKGMEDRFFVVKWFTGGRVRDRANVEVHEYALDDDAIDVLIEHYQKKSDEMIAKEAQPWPSRIS
jgi:hypothetical protein